VAKLKIWLRSREVREFPPTEIGGKDIRVWAGVAIRFHRDGREEQVPTITVYNRGKGVALVDIELDEEEVIKLFDEVRHMYEELVNRPEDNVGWGE